MESLLSRNTSNRQVETTLRRLDQILVKIDSYKPLLDHHANCVELEIKANFDSLIDALSQRQLCLLKQLNNVYTEKVLLIDSHKKSLEAIRAGIKSCLSTKSASDSRVQELISRAESAMSNATSDPFISFRNELSVLPQAIANYGRVVSRYGGHFANPAQPSSCLPLAIEEEDDHEESHEHSAVCSRLPACSCVKPDLQQWLFWKSHRCLENSTYGGRTEKTFGSLLSASVTNRENVPTQPTALCESGNIMETQPPVLQLLQTPWLQHWFDSQPQSKSLECSQIANCSRKHSDTSDYTLGNVSTSFSIVTESMSNRAENLKDWLFCDPGIKLSDVPGMSTKHSQTRCTSQQPVPTTASLNLSDWLVSTPQPSVAEAMTHTTTDRVQSSSTHSTRITSVLPQLLPAHLTQSGPIDLNRWLAPDRRPSASSTVGRPMDSPFEVTSPEDMAVVATEPMSHVTGVNDDVTFPDYCIYSQCRGGPGGPTCCGARMQCSKALDCSAVACDKTVSNTQSTPGSCPPVSASVADSSKYTEGALSQLKHIAATHWSQWLAGEPHVSGTTNLSNTGVDDPCVWLHPSVAERLLKKATASDFLDCDDSAAPPVYRNTGPTSTVLGDTCHSDTTVVQSPAKLTFPIEFSTTLSRSDGPDQIGLPKSYAAPESSELSVASTNADDHECWLFQKMSNLSTGPGAPPMHEMAN